MKNIAIIGVGGVGGYFGGKIAKALQDNSEYNVYFIARGEHLKKIQENGLILKTCDGEKQVCKLKGTLKIKINVMKENCLGYQ